MNTQWLGKDRDGNVVVVDATTGKIIPLKGVKVPTEHYHYGSGEHGCLYDNGPHYADTVEEAVDSLAQTFDLGRTRRATLKRDHYLELNPSRDGASYCEITSCTDDCKTEDYE